MRRYLLKMAWKHLSSLIFPWNQESAQDRTCLVSPTGICLAGRRSAKGWCRFPAKWDSGSILWPNISVEVMAIRFYHKEISLDKEIILTAIVWLHKSIHVRHINQGWDRRNAKRSNPISISPWEWNSLWEWHLQQSHEANPMAGY